MATLDTVQLVSVRLPTGVTCPVPAVELALNLEQRGVRLFQEAGRLCVEAVQARLSDDDLLAVACWRQSLLVLVAALEQQP